MQQRQLGNLYPTGALTLGGGGIGQVWGPTTQDEAIATVRAAYDGGIRLFDMAPLYGRGEAETVMGLAYPDGYPADLKLTTKCLLGTVPEAEVHERLSASIEKSCARLKRDAIDLFILHGAVVPDGFSGGPRAQLLPRIAVPLSLFDAAVVPAMQALKDQGRIKAWGITAAGPYDVNREVIERAGHTRACAPQVVQCMTNLLDSPGSMALNDETPRPRDLIATANRHGVGVMGIRAVAAGALTDSVDRELDPATTEAHDFERTGPFRRFAQELGTSAATLAHRYALSMSGVETVVLGVKNRRELDECLSCETAGALEPEVIDAIDALPLGNQAFDEGR